MGTTLSSLPSQLPLALGIPNPTPPARQSSPPHHALHPALIAITHAIASFHRAARYADATAFHSFAVCIFDKEDYDAAFAMPVFRPEDGFDSEQCNESEGGGQSEGEEERMSEQARLAEEWLRVAGREFVKRPVEDGFELFLEEVGEYEWRKHEMVLDAMPPWESEEEEEEDMDGLCEELVRFEKEWKKKSGKGKVEDEEEAYGRVVR